METQILQCLILEVKEVWYVQGTLLGDMPIKFIGKNFALFYPGIKH